MDTSGGQPVACMRMLIHPPTVLPNKNSALLLTYVKPYCLNVQRSYHYNSMTTCYINKLFEGKLAHWETLTRIFMLHAIWTSACHCSSNLDIRISHLKCKTCCIHENHGKVVHPHLRKCFGSILWSEAICSS